MTAPNFTNVHQCLQLALESEQKYRTVDHQYLKSEPCIYQLTGEKVQLGKIKVQIVSKYIIKKMSHESILIKLYFAQPN